MLKFTPVVGQQVATHRSGSWGEGSYTTGYVVVKVTPKGQVVIKRQAEVPNFPNTERRFDKDGYEMSKFSGRYSRTRLVPIEEATQAIELRAKRNAILAVFAKVAHKAAEFDRVSMGDRETYLTMVGELEVLLAEAREAADAMA